MTTPDIHTRSQEALSAAYDEPRSVRAADLKKAREHLRRCPRCRAFEAALAQGGPAAGGVQPDERASDDLLAGIMAAVDAERLGVPSQDRDDAEASTGDPAAGEAPADAPGYRPPEPGETPARRRGGHRRSAVTRSGLRWGFGVAAAAVFVVALFVGARIAVGPNGLGGGAVTSGVLPGGENTASAPQRSSAESAPALDPSSAPSRAARDSAPGAPPAASGTPVPKGGKAATPTATSEPVYARQPALLVPALGPEQASGYVPPVTPLTDQPVFLSFGSTDAWRFDGWLRNTPPTSLVRVGRVRARLGAAVPRQRAVFEAPGDRSARYVQWGADDFQVYRPVRQPIGRRTYVLTTSIPIADWGRWPAWPSRALPYPAGRTAYSWARPDASATPTYVSPRVRAERGLAVAPRAVLGSPTVKLPGWSWWRARGPR